MPTCFFVSDLHGSSERYQSLFNLISLEMPDAVFIGGDILPSGSIFRNTPSNLPDDFINRFLIRELETLRNTLKDRYPYIFIIMGNDDPRSEEISLLSETRRELWHYVHNRRIQWNKFQIFGYSYVPPTPFMLKDWERYDVSRYVDPGCVSPESGYYTVPVAENEKRYSTIKQDLEKLNGIYDLSNTIFLFHSPPYRTKLDRVALDGKMIDHVPLDINVGSIAIREFIETRQPAITLHGHIHESARLTGTWQDMIGDTYLFSAAHYGPELSLIRFDPEYPQNATRELI
jgi:Icc-related predicted phosphoesterase